MVIIGSSRYTDEIAAVAQRERAAGHAVEAPEFTGDQPTDVQIERWKRVMTAATEVVLVVGAEVHVGEHVRAELEHARRECLPVRLVMEVLK